MKARGRFPLQAELSGPIRPGPLPSVVRIPLCGLAALVAVGELVRAGQPVARGEGLTRGDAHTPVAGEVESISGDTLVIRTDPAGGEVAPAPLPPGLSGEGLAASLRAMGLDLDGLEHAALLIVNAVNPEPGVRAPQRILHDFQPALAEGVKVLKRLVGAGRVVLAVARGTELGLPGTERVEIEPVYPLGLAALVVRAVTGRESFAGVSIVDVARVLAAGEAAAGRPVTGTIVSLGADEFRLALGTTLAELFALAGVTPHGGDRVLIGGPLRGAAQHTLEAPVSKWDQALTVVPAGSHPGFGDEACINCGACTRICPVRIMVSLMNRACEFGHYDLALRYDLDVCLECGLCAFVCPARRPILQYIRLARAELRSRAEPLGSVP